MCICKYFAIIWMKQQISPDLRWVLQSGGSAFGMLWDYNLCMGLFSQVKGWISAGPLLFNKMLVLLSMITTQSHISERTFQGGRKFQSIKVCQWKNNETMCFGCMFRAYLQVIPYHFPSCTFLYTMFYNAALRKDGVTTHTQPPKPATCKSEKDHNCWTFSHKFKTLQTNIPRTWMFIIYQFSTLPSEIPSKL